MRRILVSACLMGEPVRHDGSHRRIDHGHLETWLSEGRLVPFCPEVAGGLPTPRPTAEIVECDERPVEDVNSPTRVLDSAGLDVTAQFLQGAYAALAVARSSGCRYALLTDGSPSCGSTFVYDGSFSGRRRAGIGMTTAVLNQHGVSVFNPASLHELAEAIRRAD